MQKEDVKPLRTAMLEYILAALAAFEGNRTHTIKALKISARGLRYYIAEARYFGMHPMRSKAEKLKKDMETKNT